MPLVKKTQREYSQNIIKNVGLFWQRDKVLWAGNRGIGEKRLMGKNSKQKRNIGINFWKQSGIYALYNNYNLVYVGQTRKSRLGQRLKDHLSDDLAGRWNMFSWFGFQKVKANGELSIEAKIKITHPDHLKDILEGIVIAVAEPLMNGQQGRFGPNVERYLQIDESNLSNQDETQKSILSKLEMLEKKTNKILKTRMKQVGK